MRHRGFSLAEVVISLGLSTLVLLGLFLLTRGGTRQFELSSAQVFLSQHSRDAIEDSLTLTASCVSPLTETATTIYSPTAGCSEDPSLYPNVYSLDFVSCCDFLDPRFADQPQATRGYLDRRGGTRFRYRILFDGARQQLRLERLLPDGPVGRADVDTSVPSRLLAQGLERVTFTAVGQTVHMSVLARTVKADGEAQGGLQVSDGRRSRDNTDPTSRQARSLQLFTVLTIPSRTTR